MTKTSTPAQPTTYDVFSNATGSRVHLADAAGFICGTPVGRAKWSCHAVNIPRVGPSFGCLGCLTEMEKRRQGK